MVKYVRSEMFFYTYLGYKGIYSIFFLHRNDPRCKEYWDLRKRPPKTEEQIQVRHVYGVTRTTSARPLGVGVVTSSIHGPNRVLAKDVKSCTNGCYVRCASQYLTQLGLSDKGRAIKGLVVCND